jgi:hypothetical protein
VVTLNLPLANPCPPERAMIAICLTAVLPEFSHPQVVSEACLSSCPVDADVDADCVPRVVAERADCSGPRVAHGRRVDAQLACVLDERSAQCGSDLFGGGRALVHQSMP